jgi:DNA repair exonuclease SbcCD ATPase subunit
MRPIIQDEFTKLKVSRQRKSQLRRTRDGLCPICGKPKLDKGKNKFCQEHYDIHLVRTNKFNRKLCAEIKKKVVEIKEAQGLEPTERASFNTWTEARKEIRHEQTNSN